MPTADLRVDTLRVAIGMIGDLVDFTHVVRAGLTASATRRARSA